MAEVRIDSWLNHEWVIANHLARQVRSAIATWLDDEVFGNAGLHVWDLVGRQATVWVYTAGLRIRFEVLRYEPNARRFIADIIRLQGSVVVRLQDIDPRIVWQHPQMPPAIVIDRGLATYCKYCGGLVLGGLGGARWGYCGGLCEV